MGHNYVSDTRKYGVLPGSRPRLWALDVFYRHSKAIAVALALAPALFGRHAALEENSETFIMPGSENLFAASGGRC